MSSQTRTLPAWTWDDLDEAFEQFGRSSRLDPIRTHLLQGLRDDAETAPPREFLKQVLSAGWILAQVGASATALHPEDGPSASSS